MYKWGGRGQIEVVAPLAFSGLIIIIIILKQFNNALTVLNNAPNYLYFFNIKDINFKINSV